ncbi:MAG: phosphoglycerate dehydrogenase [Chloroflexi bacterium]|nr:phosphoglycerate dehydrogenase [Chloroflexota bacterium]
MATFKVLVADPIHQQGIDLLKSQPEVAVDVKLRQTPEALAACIGEYDALIVRSETQVNAAVLGAGKRLQVVGRAGVGVDNIDVEEATRRGVAVVNAPTGNIVAAAEHTIALLLAMARNVPQADSSLKRGEWKRGQFTGVEVRNKVLGLIGLGRVGSEVARRALGLQMQVLAYDPYVSPDYAKRLGVALATIDEVLGKADFLSLHTPLTEDTRHLLGPKELARTKPGVRIINAARGALVDEGALREALDAGKVAGVALDVFTTEPPSPDHPLVGHAKVIVTPHLGASTVEAQAEVGREVAEQVLAVLRGQPARNTVNAPLVPPEVRSILAPYLAVAATLGKLAIQLVEGQLQSITLRYDGEIATHDTAILKAAALVGLLQPVSSERVNLVNAAWMADQRGLRIVEQKGPAPEQYTSLVSIEAQANDGAISLAGTHMRGETHIVQIRGYWLDLVPSVPYLLVIDHLDRPGMIGAVGTITGGHDINISFMEVGRYQTRGRAVMVLGLDDPVPDPVLAKIRSIPHITSAKVVRL